jgi:hypothetical protein
MSSADVLDAWPQESHEAAQIVVDTYGEPDESTPTRAVRSADGGRA